MVFGVFVACRVVVRRVFYYRVFRLRVRDLVLFGFGVSRCGFLLRHADEDRAGAQIDRAMPEFPWRLVFAVVLQPL